MVFLCTGVVITCLCVILSGTGMVITCLCVIRGCRSMVTFRTGVVFDGLGVVGFCHLVVVYGGLVVLYRCLVVTLRTGVVFGSLSMVGYGHGMVFGKDSLAVILVQLTLSLSSHAACLLTDTLLFFCDSLLLGSHASLLLVDAKVLLGYTILFCLHTGTLSISTSVLGTNASILSIDAGVLVADACFLVLNTFCLVFSHLRVKFNDVVGFGLDAAHVDDAEPPLLVCQRVSYVTTFQ